MQRDLRIDFFRGLALLSIMVVHIEWQTGANWFVYCSPRIFGPIDSLDVFVFLSGYVFGLVYSRILAKEGYWSCQRKALMRAWQLYIANCAIFLAVLCIILFFSWEQTDFVQTTRFNEAVGQPITASLHVLALSYQPYNFDILPLYIVLLVLAPLILVLLSRDWTGGLLASYLLYALPQLYPSFNLPLVTPSQKLWLFNPFSWQFLFAIAMFLSMRRGSKLHQLLDHKWVLGISIVALIGISTAYLKSEGYTGRVTNGVLPWSDKTTLGPLRLFYFLCLVRVISFCLPEASGFWHAKLVAPLINCGQHSLPIFCSGVILVYLSVAWHEVADLGNLASLAVELGAIGLSVSFAYLLTYVKTIKKTGGL